MDKAKPTCCHSSYGLRTANVVYCKLPVRYFTEFWDGKRQRQNFYCTRHAKRRGAIVDGMKPIEQAVTK